MIVKANFPTDTAETLADLVKRLGDVPLDRILLKPAPGTATEKDLIAALEAPRKRICELMDGVLVEKALGARESMLGAFIASRIWNHVEPADLGIVLGPDAPLRMRRGLVRFPSVSFISWERIPGAEFPEDEICDIAPNLAIDVLRVGNTHAEMQIKMRDYFQAGVQLAWLIDPIAQTAAACTSPTKRQPVGRDGVLDAGAALPGFKLSLKELFAHGKRRRGQR